MNDTIDEFTQGWTAPIDYTLKHRTPSTGAEATFNATGMTPSIVLKDKDGAAIDVTGDVSWADATVSKIRYTPDATDLTSAGSPYTVHFKVTDGSSISFYPQGAALKWRVFAQ